MKHTIENLQKQDPEIAAVLTNELKRQRECIELIPSENIVSKAVLEAAGSVLTNKYSEGYPGKRYYGGNEHVDVSEQLAIDRAKEIFGAEYANVQPHSGANANMAVYLGLLNPGDTVLGLKLDHGGHLTHGHPINASGVLYNFVQYELNAEGKLDYDIIRAAAIEHQPKMIIAGFSAYSHELDFVKFKEIADEVGALLMADVAHIAGLIAAKIHPQPFPHCDVVTSTTHKTLRGPRGGLILAKKEHAKALNRAVFPGLQGGPLEHIIAAKAVCFGEALRPEFVEYQKQIVTNAKALCASLQENEITVVSGSTNNHLLLIDLTQEKIRGVEAENLLDVIGMTANKNTIPHDPGTPFKPSGLRIGTPVLTTRGMGVEEMKLIGKWIAQVIKNPENAELHLEIGVQVKELCAKFPIYE